LLIIHARSSSYETENRKERRDTNVISLDFFPQLILFYGIISGGEYVRLAIRKGLEACISFVIKA